MCHFAKQWNWVNVKKKKKTLVLSPTACLSSVSSVAVTMPSVQPPLHETTSDGLTVWGIVRARNTVHWRHIGLFIELTWVKHAERGWTINLKILHEEIWCDYTLKIGHEESAVLALDLWDTDTDCFSGYKNKLAQMKLIHWMGCFCDPLGWLKGPQILINVA